MNQPENYELFKIMQGNEKPESLEMEAEKPAVIKSTSTNQIEILENIKALYTDGKNFDADITYGNGIFYKGSENPNHCFDIDPLKDHVVKACSTNIPMGDESLESIVFDPPFLTYVRAARKGNGQMVMAGRFSGYWKYQELEDHYKGTLKEAARLLKKKGIMVFKCQDIIHNHKMHCTHANTINWAAECGLSLKDLFILNAKHRMPAPNRKGKQKHARIFHCYFLVFEKR